MNFYAKRRPKPALQIISMIDLLIVLLIFLAASTSFKEATNNLQLALPQSATGKGTADNQFRLDLTVAKDARVQLGADLVAMDKLAAAISAVRESQPDLKLAVRIDKDASFGVTVQVLDALKQSGCRPDQYSIITARP
jgi:biopolymer transport protein ExbD